MLFRSGKEYTELFAARGHYPSEGVGESQVRIQDEIDGSVHNRMPAQR